MDHSEKEKLYTPEQGDVMNALPKEHSNEHEQTHEYLHEHGIPHSHEHPHTHTQTKAVLNRLSRAIGHLESVKRMVEEERDCTEVLVQLAAVRSALSSTAKVILKDHLEHCISDGDSSFAEQIATLNDAIDKFMN